MICGQAVVTVRFSLACFEGFEALRQKLSNESGAEISRNALGRSLIEKQLVSEGTLKEGGTIKGRKARTTTQMRLEAVEGKLAALKTRVEREEATRKTDVPFFE
jgi:hypothetical protein